MIKPNNKKTKKTTKKLSKDSKKKVKRNSKGQLEKGSILNPEGKKLGTKNFATKFEEDIEIYAKAEGMSVEKVEQLKAKARIKGLIKGDFNFHKDTDDRIYGKPEENINFESETLRSELEELRKSLKQYSLNEKSQSVPRTPKTK